MHRVIRNIVDNNKIIFEMSMGEMNSFSQEKMCLYKQLRTMLRTRIGKSKKNLEQAN